MTSCNGREQRDQPPSVDSGNDGTVFTTGSATPPFSQAPGQSWGSEAQAAPEGTGTGVLNKLSDTALPPTDPGLDIRGQTVTHRHGDAPGQVNDPLIGREERRGQLDRAGGPWARPWARPLAHPPHPRRPRALLRPLGPEALLGGRVRLPPSPAVLRGPRRTHARSSVVDSARPRRPGGKRAALAATCGSSRAAVAVWPPLNRRDKHVPLGQPVRERSAAGGQQTVRETLRP